MKLSDLLANRKDKAEFMRENAVPEFLGHDVDSIIEMGLTWAKGVAFDVIHDNLFGYEEPPDFFIANNHIDLWASPRMAGLIEKAVNDFYGPTESGKYVESRIKAAARQYYDAYPDATPGDIWAKMDMVAAEIGKEMLPYYSDLLLSNESSSNKKTNENKYPKNKLS